MDLAAERVQLPVIGVGGYDVEVAVHEHGVTLSSRPTCASTLVRPGSASHSSLSIPTSSSRVATCSAALRSPGPGWSPKLVVSIRIRSRQISVTSAAGS